MPDTIRYITPADAEWPHQLNDLVGVRHNDMGGMPERLWLRGTGDLRELTANAVAMVGSRSATSYGHSIASDMASQFAHFGVTVVSGAAFGIDQAAHRGALAAGGPTVAVVATGVDRPYPQAHAALIDRIAETGLVVSEYAPGSTPTRTRFLERNRIIAALAQGTVVVEAALRSGALNAATWTERTRRPLWAVPGPVNSATSEGCHNLIRQHRASLVTCAADVLEDRNDRGIDTLERDRS